MENEEHPVPWMAKEYVHNIIYCHPIIIKQTQLYSQHLLQLSLPDSRIRINVLRLIHEAMATFFQPNGIKTISVFGTSRCIIDRRSYYYNIYASRLIWFDTKDTNHTENALELFSIDEMLRLMKISDRVTVIGVGQSLIRSLTNVLETVPENEMSRCHIDLFCFSMTDECNMAYTLADKYYGQITIFFLDYLFGIATQILRDILRPLPESPLCSVSAWHNPIDYLDDYCKDNIHTIQSYRSFFYSTQWNIRGNRYVFPRENIGLLQINTQLKETNSFLYECVIHTLSAFLQFPCLWEETPYELSIPSRSIIIICLGTTFNAALRNQLIARHLLESDEELNPIVNSNQVSILSQEWTRQLSTENKALAGLVYGFSKFSPDEINLMAIKGCISPASTPPQSASCA
jgi:hypothetical protein